MRLRNLAIAALVFLSPLAYGAEPGRTAAPSPSSQTPPPPPTPEELAFRAAVQQLELIQRRIFSFQRQAVFAGTAGTPSLRPNSSGQEIASSRALILSQQEVFSSFNTAEKILFIPPLIRVQMETIALYAHAWLRLYPNSEQAFSREITTLCPRFTNNTELLQLLRLPGILGEREGILEIDNNRDGTFRVCFSQEFLLGFLAAKRDYGSPEEKMFRLSQMALLQTLAQTRALAALLANEGPSRFGGSAPGLDILLDRLPALEQGRIDQELLAEFVRKAATEIPAATNLLSDDFIREIARKLVAPEVAADEARIRNLDISGLANVIRTELPELRQASLRVLFASALRGGLNEFTERQATEALLRAEASAIFTRLLLIDRVQEASVREALWNLLEERLKQAIESPPALAVSYGTRLKSLASNPSALADGARAFLLSSAEAAQARAAALSAGRASVMPSYEILSAMRKQEPSFLGGSERVQSWRKSLIESDSGGAAARKYFQIVTGITREQITNFAQATLKLGALQETRTEERRNIRRQNPVRAGVLENDIADTTALLAMGAALRLEKYASPTPPRTLSDLGLTDSERERFQRTAGDLELNRYPLVSYLRQNPRLSLARPEELARAIHADAGREASLILRATTLVELERFIGSSKVVRVAIDAFPRESRARREWLESQAQPSIAREIWDNAFFSYVMIGGMPLIALQGMQMLAPRFMPRWAAYLGTAMESLGPFLKGFNYSIFGLIPIQIGLDTQALLRQRDARDEISRLSGLAIQEDGLVFDRFDYRSASAEYENTRFTYLITRSLDVAMFIGLPIGFYIKQTMFGSRRLQFTSSGFSRVEKADQHEAWFRSLGLRSDSHYRWDADLIREAAELRRVQIRNLSTAAPGPIERARNQLIGALRSQGSRSVDVADLELLGLRGVSTASLSEEIVMEAALQRLRAVNLENASALRQATQAERRLLADLGSTERKLQRLGAHHRFDFEALGLEMGTWNPILWREARATVLARVEARELPRSALETVDNVIRRLRTSLLQNIPGMTQPDLTQFYIAAMGGRGRHMQVIDDLVRGGQLPNGYPIDYHVIPMGEGEAPLLIARLRAGSAQ